MPPRDESNSQRRYYERYEERSGEAVTSPNKVARGPGRRRGLIISLIAVVVALAVVGAVAGLQLGGGSKEAGPATPTKPAATPAASAQPSDPATWVNPSAAPTFDARPLQPGWTAVVARSNLAKAVYDVPKKNWYKPGDMIYGYTDSKGGNRIAVGSASGYRRGFCKTDESSVLAFVGFRGIGSMDPVQEAPDVARDFAKAISLKDDDTSHAPIGRVKTENVTIQGLPGVKSTVVATAGDPDKKSCDAKKVEVRTVGVTMGTHPALLVLVRALNVPHALTDEQATAIMHTLRPAEG